MKAIDIINQLRRVLPNLTDKFTTNFNISTLTKTAGVATATASAAHGLSTGNYVYITGAIWKTSIVSITRVGTVATVVTSTPHDLTERWFNTATMSGAVEAQFNGTFTLLSVPNRYTYTIEVANSGPTSVTGTPILQEAWRPGFNGWVQVTVTGATTFTYVTSSTLTTTATGTIQARWKPRIGGAASVDRATAAYSNMASNLLWAFVVMEDVNASKSKYTLSDAIGDHTSPTSFRQVLINNIKVYVYVPTHDELTALSARDLMTDVSKYLYKSILGKVYPTYFVDVAVGVLHVKGHQQLEYKGAYYIHEFAFEGASEITTNDIVEPEVTYAFRDLILSFEHPDSVDALTTHVNLDDFPI